MAGWQATLTRIIRYLLNAFAVPSRPARVRSGPEWSALVLGLGFVVAAQAEAPDFLRDVRPVLSQHCFKCHGPDEQARKAGLRLDQRDAALAPLRSGKPAIVPGSPDASEFVKRLYTEDEDDLMPPPATKRPLTDAQKDVLRRWVAVGAPYQPHWAFLAPKQVEPPAVRQTEWPLGPLDHFVLARLEAEGLAPSPPADRHRLIRRVSLDLIGLPPTPEEADAFARDPAPDPEAYARVVDRLLASPHYGERWARRWLDLARYADTNGFEKDRPRSIWPWRDWVIEALNADLPFDQFTIQQLAGDLLPGATPAQRIATGFHRNTMLNEEGGIDPLEYRFYSVVDRVNTTGTTWLGLTVGCAQCHTHKYDPISQREYYRFLAFLNNADEPVLEVPSPELEPKRRAILAEIASLEADLVHRFPPEEHWQDATPVPTFVAQSGAAGGVGSDGTVQLAGESADKDVYTLTLTTDLTRVGRLKLEALTDPSLPKSGPGRSEGGNFVLTEIEVTVAPGDGSEAPVPVRIARAEADFSQSGFGVARAIDGKPDTGWAIGGGANPNVNRTATFTLAEPAVFASGTRLTVRLVQQFGGRHTLGRFRLSVGEEIPDARPLAERRAAHRDAKLRAWVERERERAVPWTLLTPLTARGSVPVLTIEPDGGVFVTSDQTKSDTYDLTYRVDPRRITALRLEVLPDDRLPLRGPGRVDYEGPIGDFFLSTFRVQADGQPVAFTRATSSFAAGGNDATKAIDDDPQSGWSIDGGQGRRHTAVFHLAEPRVEAGELAVHLLFEKHYSAGLGRFRLWATDAPSGGEASPLPDDLLALTARRFEDLTDAERERLLRHFVTVAPELAAEREPIEKLRRELPAYPTTLVMRERPPENPRPTFVHHRGEFLSPRERVEPGVFAVLPDLPEGAPRNRLGLARWLVSPDNPLTARVTVNREWAAFFGRGLVATVDDFGFQGELPTHPELLDWLAVEFIKQGWSLKRLHRLIVTSATYQQDSVVRAGLLERDPQNRWLARAPRVRLEAELVRDTALSAAGLLSPKLGGPSVFPPQPASVTKEGAYGPLDWQVSPGEDRYRRGLYTFAKRTAPFAMFNTFDGPSGEACVARREVSNTPLQALTLLNDEVFHEAAQALGRVTATAPGEEAGRARFLLRRCLTREPDVFELERVLHFYRVQKARFAADEGGARVVAGEEAGERGDGGRDGTRAVPEPSTGAGGTPAPPNESHLAGGRPAPPDAVERAAWTAVARVVLNLDEAVTKN